MNKPVSALAAVILLATATVVAGPAGADDNPEHRRGHHGAGGADFGIQRFGDPQRLVRHLSRTLDLSDAQETSISNIVGAAQPEIDALREQGRANFEAMRELDPQASDYSTVLQNLAAENGRLANEATLLHGRLRAEIHAQLTPEQREQIAERGEETRFKGRRHREASATEQ